MNPGKIRVIPHGVPVMTHAPTDELRQHLGLAGRTVISTFGLVDPRKGLEFMVEAMEQVAVRHPNALYLILGRTHPELVARDGELYRSSLSDAIARRGLVAHVRWWTTFPSSRSLTTSQ